jgi:hypothetical protein
LLPIVEIKGTTLRIPFLIFASALIQIAANVAMAKEVIKSVGVIQINTPVFERPGTLQSQSDNSVQSGMVVYLLQRQGNWVLIKRMDGQAYGWVNQNDVVSSSSFKAVRSWNVKDQKVVGGGDYEARYQFLRDGSFVVEETAMQGEDKYYLVTHKGRLFRNGKFVWARVLNQPLAAIRLFAINKNGFLCWQADTDLSCETP